MDIAALSTAMYTAECMNQISFQILDMNLDNAEILGDGFKKMLEMSVTPHIGGNFDVSI